MLFSLGPVQAMPLSSIVVIVMRLFALNWLVSALPLLLSAATTPVLHERPTFAVPVAYVPGGLLLLLAIAVWFLSSPIARLVTRGVDTPVTLGSLARSDLYSFAFVFLGLFFVLSSLADVINWTHYFTVSPEDPRHDPYIQNFYQLTRPCITLAVGLVSLFGAPRWTRNLVARDHKSQQAQPHDGADGGPPHES
jgi:hypothetical protein